METLSQPLEISFSAPNPAEFISLMGRVCLVGLVQTSSDGRVRMVLEPTRDSPKRDETERLSADLLASESQIEILESEAQRLRSEIEDLESLRPEVRFL